MISGTRTWELYSVYRREMESHLWRGWLAPPQFSWDPTPSLPPPPPSWLYPKCWVFFSHYQPSTHPNQPQTRPYLYNKSIYSQSAFFTDSKLFCTFSLLSSYFLPISINISISKIRSINRIRIKKILSRGIIVSTIHRTNQHQWLQCRDSGKVTVYDVILFSSGLESKPSLNHFTFKF